GRAYPRWMVEGWSVIERWRNSEDFAIAPRVYRRMARRLIHAENRWRGGDPPAQVRRDLEDDLHELGGAMDPGQQTPQPPIRSAGQARVLQGCRPDPALSAAFLDLFKKRRSLGDATPDLLKAAVTETLAKLKGKTSLDLAGALVDAAGDEVLDPPT